MFKTLEGVQNTCKGFWPHVGKDVHVHQIYTDIVTAHLTSVGPAQAPPNHEQFLPDCYACWQTLQRVGVD